MEILLNSLKNIRSVDADNYGKIELSNTPSQLIEYDIRNVLSATEIFDGEREASEVYRIYGKIEYLSLLNGLKLQYSKFQDFFTPQFSGNSKSTSNSFDFYLVKPMATSSGSTQILGNTIRYYTGLTGTSSFVEGTTSYKRHFQVIATNDDFEIYPAGFSNNVYGDQAYAFNFNKDFDVSPYLDSFGIPLTELYLYLQYKPSTTPYPIEAMYMTTWDATTGAQSKLLFAPKTFIIGDIVESYFNNKIDDLIGYSKRQFYETELAPQIFYVTTPYMDGYTSKRLMWKYNPFIPLTLRYFGSNLDGDNISGTSYEQVSSIPYYATPVDSRGNYVWRTILEQGYIDPISNLGVDYPFVNKCRYLFSNIILNIVPDLSDQQTYDAFKDVWFSRYPKKLSTLPTGDINDIGKPCK